MVVNTKSDQQSGEEDLYTVLGFKGKGDFQDKMNNIFSNDNKELKKLRDKLFGKLKKKIMTDEKNNQAAKNINDQITKSKTTESKLSNLLEFKKQLEAFLKDQDNHGIVFNEIDSVSVAPVVEVNGINPKWSKIKKLKKAQPLTSNRQDFENALGYIKSKEEVMGITLEELSEYKQNSVKIFLLNHVNSCKNKSSQLHSGVEEATAILSSDKLRIFYDEAVENKVLQPILSYGGYKQIYDETNYAKN